MVGNNDKALEERQVTKLEGEKLKDTYDFKLFREVSSETGYNIKNLK